jgi:hypothetical protein
MRGDEGQSRSAAGKTFDEVTAEIADLSHLKAFAGSLDALIRAARVSPAAADKVASRVMGQWEEAASVAVSLGATELRAEEHVVLTAEGDRGTWLLPAFMSGLRRFSPTEAVTWEDLRGLAEELSGLAPSLQTIYRFRDWLFCDGAEGFEVGLDVSFSEGADVSLDNQLEKKKEIIALRAQAAETLAQSSFSMDSTSLDLASMREEMDVPLEFYADSLAERTLSLQEDEKAELQRFAEDSLFWVEGQISLALEHSEIRGALPPERLARRIVSQVAAGIDLRFIELLSELGRSTDPYAKAVLQALEQQPIGEQIARRVPLSLNEIASLVPLLQKAPKHIGVGLATGLVERCCRTQESAQWIGRLASEAGVEQFVTLVSAHGLSCEAGMLVGLLAVQGKLSPTRVAEILGSVAAEARVSVLARTPPGLLSECHNLISDLLMEPVHSKSYRRFVLSVLQCDDDSLRHLIGRILLKTRGKQWDSQVLKDVCTALTKGDLADLYVVPLVRNRQVDPTFRLLLLHLLEEGAPEAFSKAVRWSILEFSEPVEIRRVLRAVRGRLTNA